MSILPYKFHASISNTLQVIKTSKSKKGQFDSRGGICWQYYSTYPAIKDLAKFAFPLMGIIAYEASCERAFLQHHRITGDQGMKAGILLLKRQKCFLLQINSCCLHLLNMISLNIDFFRNNGVNFFN